jgi:hypothetical protein
MDIFTCLSYVLLFFFYPRLVTPSFSFPLSSLPFLSTSCLDITFIICFQSSPSFYMCFWVTMAQSLSCFISIRVSLSLLSSDPIPAITICHSHLQTHAFYLVCLQLTLMFRPSCCISCHHTSVVVGITTHVHCSLSLLYAFSLWECCLGLFSFSALQNSHRLPLCLSLSLVISSLHFLSPPVPTRPASG